MKKLFLLVVLSLVSCGTAYAGSLQIDMNLLTEEGHIGEGIGVVTISETRIWTWFFTPKLEKLGPGLHGFHVHQNPSCRWAEKDGKTVPGLLPEVTTTQQRPACMTHLLVRDI